jgi:hypothetical protein
VASIGEAVRIAPTTLPVLSLAHAPATAGERDSATRTLASIEDRELARMFRRTRLRSCTWLSANWVLFVPTRGSRTS